MTDQEIFEECVLHVLKQGAPSVKGEECRYLSDGNLSCAIGGPLVARGLHRPSIEGCIPSMEKHDDADGHLARALSAWGVESDQYPLLRAIQKTHDDNASSMHFLHDFHASAMNVANFYDLDWSVLA